MKKREAKWNTLLNQFLREKKLHCYFELKQTTADSISFSAVKEHQINGLLAAQKNGLVWKYSDEDQREKPFDGASTPPLVSYVVIKYPPCFLFIPISWFILEKKNSDKRKSLTLERAYEISSHRLYV